MATSGTTPPSACKIKLVRPLRTGETTSGDCTTVDTSFMYVVLSDNPENTQSATVSWPAAGNIPVQVLPGNNLILRGATTQETAPATVTLQFEGSDPADEPCSVTTCVPEGC